MQNIIQSELLKMRRCQILLVGIAALTLCPIVQYGSQLIMDPSLREESFDFALLFSNVIWGNTQIFLPISLVMIGGWSIDREASGGTLKNIMAIPVSMPGLLGAKLAVTALLALFLGLYSAVVTLLTGFAAGLSGLTPALALRCSAQTTAAALLTCVVCMPMILIFGQIRGAYLGGSIFTFFLGYSMLFFKSGTLLSAYPFSAALILAGFDMRAYNGAVSAPDPLLSAASLSMTAVLTAILLLFSRGSGMVTSSSPKPAKRRRRR